MRTNFPLFILALFLVSCAPLTKTPALTPSPTEPPVSTEIPAPTEKPSLTPVVETPTAAITATKEPEPTSCLDKKAQDKVVTEFETQRYASHDEFIQDVKVKLAKYREVSWNLDESHTYATSGGGSGVLLGDFSVMFSNGNGRCVVFAFMALEPDGVGFASMLLDGTYRGSYIIALLVDRTRTTIARKKSPQETSQWLQVHIGQVLDYGYYVAFSSSKIARQQSDNPAKKDLLEHSIFVQWGNDPDAYKKMARKGTPAFDPRRSSPADLISHLDPAAEVGLIITALVEPDE